MSEEKDVSWSKLAATCSCGSHRFEIFRFEGVYSRACCSCGLVSHYLEKFLTNPQPGHLTHKDVEKLVQATVTHFSFGK